MEEIVLYTVTWMEENFTADKFATFVLILYYMKFIMLSKHMQKYRQKINAIT